LATVFLDNPNSTSDEAFTVDLFIASSAPPPAFASNVAVSFQNWPGGVWDWATANAQAASVQVPPETRISLEMDWPQKLADGTAAQPGEYWAVVRVVAPSSLASYATPEIATPILLTG
jgi:hypothetical protein